MRVLKDTLVHNSVLVKHLLWSWQIQHSIQAVYSCAIRVETVRAAGTPRLRTSCNALIPSTWQKVFNLHYTCLRMSPLDTLKLRPKDQNCNVGLPSSES